MYSKNSNKIKKIVLAFFLLGCVVMLLPACKNKSQKETSTVLEMQQQTYLEQKNMSYTSKPVLVIRVILFTILGAVLGGFIGYALYNVVINNFILDVDAEIVCCILGVIAGAILGFLLARSISPIKQNEYIDVETKFVFSQHESDEISTLVYGAAANDDASKHFLPRFSSDGEVQLTIEMQTSLIEKKIKKLSKFQKSTDVLIPVEIKISKTNNLEIKYDGGLQKDRFSYEPNSTYDTYKFFIKNNEKLSQNIKFLFLPTNKADVEIDVVYGTPDYKMVDSMCDIAQTVKFIE